MNLYVFGAGRYGQSVIKYLIQSGVRPKAIIDNDKTKHGLNFSGIEIFCPSKILNTKEDIVLIAVGDEYVDDVSKQLEKMGFKCGNNFFYANDLFYNTEDMIKNTPVNTHLPDGYYPANILDFRAIPIISVSEQKTVYRYIPEQYKERFRKVLSLLNINGILGNEFVATDESGELCKTHPNALFLKSKKLTPVTDMRFWPPKMLKAFCIWHLDYISKLNSAGLGLTDAHPYNAAYCNGKFVHYDLGSIDIIKTKFFSIEIFVSRIFNQLILISCGEHNKVYNNFKMCSSYVLNYLDIKEYMSGCQRGKYEKLMEKIVILFLKQDVAAACKLLKDFAASYIIIPEIIDQWSDYSGESLKNMLNQDSKNKLNLKYTNALKLIRKVKPRSMIDLAGNSGIMSLALINELEYAINADLDAGALDRLWDFMESDEQYKESPITPVKLDLIMPLNAILYRLMPHYKNTPVADFFEEQLKCEMTVCLAILHHITFNYALSFEQTLSCFLFYSKKYLAVEFIDISDEHLISSYGGRFESFDWYTVENFEKALLKRCNIIEKLPSEPETRTIYLCEVKQNSIEN